MAAYKAGQPVPDDEEAARLVAAGKAPEADPEVETEEVCWGAGAGTSFLGCETA